MTIAKIPVTPYIKEYAVGKFLDPVSGAVRFPSGSDIYILLYDLMQRRPVTSPIDRGNLEICLPDRREANTVGGKNPETFNYLSDRAAHILEKKLKVMMWAELHDFMDENKHLRGIQFKESIFIFMTRYGLQSISEDALFKNYQRWRYRLRRTLKRGYSRSERN